MYMISFFNTKGGVGKSTLALQVAGSIADTGAKVCIIDLDSQRSCYTFFKNCQDNKFDVFKSQADFLDADKTGKKYDVIIYDHSPERDPKNLPHTGSDVVVVPFRASGLDYLSTLTAFDVLEKRGQPVLKVLNCFVRNRELSKDFLREKIDHDCIIAERSIYSRSITQHSTIYNGMSRFTYGLSDAKKEIDNLVEKIVDKIQNK